MKIIASIFCVAVNLMTAFAPINSASAEEKINLASLQESYINNNNRLNFSSKNKNIIIKQMSERPKQIATYYCEASGGMRALCNDDQPCCTNYNTGDAYCCWAGTTCKNDGSCY